MIYTNHDKLLIEVCSHAKNSNTNIAEISDQEAESLGRALASRTTKVKRFILQLFGRRDSPYECKNFGSYDITRCYKFEGQNIFKAYIKDYDVKNCLKFLELKQSIDSILKRITTPLSSCFACSDHSFPQYSLESAAHRYFQKQLVEGSIRNAENKETELPFNTYEAENIRFAEALSKVKNQKPMLITLLIDCIL
jgi:hypothetical protein